MNQFIKKLMLIVTVVTMFFPIYADTVNLHNESDISLYAAPYYTYTKNAQQVSPAKKLVPHSNTPFERPKIKWDTGTRELAISIIPDLLKPEITGDELHLLAKQGIANPAFDNFYVVFVEGKIASFNRINWEVIQPVLKKTRAAINVLLAATIGQLRKLWEKPPYNTQQASVRLGGQGLCAEEKKYVEQRRSKAFAALKRMRIKNISPGNAPIIASCGSGGGVRSTVAFNGSKNGLAKIGLLDAIMYESTLSGATWETGPSTHFNYSPMQFKDFLKQRLPGGLLNKRFSIAQLGSSMFKKFVFDKPLSMVDIYGGALTSLFLDSPKNKEPYEVFLSAQANTIANGNRPLPIYNAITSYQPYIWLHFTPYEVGSDALGGFVPSWAFGRSFVNSLSVNYVPEEALGYLLGTFGYAIGINLKEALFVVGQDLRPEFLLEMLKKFAHETVVGKARLFPAEVNNFTFGMLGLPYGNKRTLTLLDAGIHYNLPMPPLLHKDRAVDLIFVFDNSAGTVGDELRKTEEYFKEKGIPFPAIDYTKVTNTITVFEDKNNPSTPVIIYMPLVKNDRYSKTFDPKNCPDDACSTFNFTYQDDVIDLLSGLTEFSVIENKKLIVEVIQGIVNRKNDAAAA